MTFEGGSFSTTTINSDDFPTLEERLGERGFNELLLLIGQISNARREPLVATQEGDQTFD